MAKRSNLRDGELIADTDSLDIGGVGGFVDTVGATKRKRRTKERRLGDDRDTQGSPVHRDVMKDEVEERLEEMLFGKKSFNPVPPSFSETDTDDEEGAEEKVDFGRCFFSGLGLA